MSSEFGFRSYAAMREPAKDVFTEAAMRLGLYMIATAVMTVLLAECGYSLYHLSLMVW